MRQMSARARLFVERYATEHAKFDAAALEAQTYVAGLVVGHVVPIHAVIGRPKSVTSLRGKVRRKGYDNPANEVTDLVGVRVITYFAKHVDLIEAELRAGLEVSARKSRDARLDLGDARFGYRSVHLVARLRPSPATLEQNRNIRRRWFEVQIRSILDHAWAEIEHEVVYKSGVDYPPDVRRRFKAIAGSLEVLEHAFEELSAQLDGLIRTYRAEYTVGAGLDRRFDAARLFAFLEERQPQGLSWRLAEATGRPFPSGTAVAAVEALELINLNTPRKLDAILTTRHFRESIRQFAAVEGVAPETASHLAVVVLAIAAVRPDVLANRFPEMLFSPAIATVASVDKRERRRRATPASSGRRAVRRARR